MLSFLSAELFVYAGLVFYVLGFLFRDELWLRGLLFIGTGFYIVYYYFAPSTPLWDAILTSGILGLVNLAMICVVVAERTKFTMSAETAKLYADFPNLKPGQFRRVLKRADQIEAASQTVLCREGEALDTLYFVIDGEVEISKLGTTSVVPGGFFIGEIAFLSGSLASATVTVAEGSHYLAWPHRSLWALMLKSPNLSNAFLARISDDLAGKVAASPPPSA